jgi:hypothetical protein
VPGFIDAQSGARSHPAAHKYGPHSRLEHGPRAWWLPASVTRRKRLTAATARSWDEPQGLQDGSVLAATRVISPSR